MKCPRFFQESGYSTDVDCVGHEAPFPLGDNAVSLSFKQCLMGLEPAGVFGVQLKVSFECAPVGGWPRFASPAVFFGSRSYYIHKNAGDKRTADV